MTYLLDSSLLFLLLLVSLLLLFLSLLSFSFLKQYSTVQPRTHDCSHSQPLDCWDHSQVPPFCDKWLFSRKCVILLPVMLQRLPVMAQVEEDPQKEEPSVEPLSHFLPQHSHCLCAPTPLLLFFLSWFVLSL